ncbi:REP-associated tyrosine transposase, partial [Acinetobacter baumannii]|uniref:REP-associated tyrosine transposase n=1 Tax=Acinetobacter baumannii TaxID=470 RepID=UPI003C734834
CWFFTVNLQNRRSDLLTRHIAHLRAATAFVKSKKPFLINAWVVLPEHMHCIWTLPEGDTDYSGRWRDIKKNVYPSAGAAPYLAAAILGTCHP